MIVIETSFHNPGLERFFDLEPSPGLSDVLAGEATLEHAIQDTGIPGLAVSLWWAWRWRRDDRARLLHPLVIYHVGVVIFMLTDFQYYGDFFLLLHSAAFFVGVLWVTLHEFAAGRAGDSLRPIIAGVMLALAVAAARPGVLRPEIQLVTQLADPAVTLDDQRQVARAVSRRVGDGSLVLLAHSELLVLMQRRNALPLVYCNLAVWFRHRRDADESWSATCTRLLLDAEADALVLPKVVGHDALLRHGYTTDRFVSDSGRYFVSVAFRPAGDAVGPRTDH